MPVRINGTTGLSGISSVTADSFYIDTVASMYSHNQDFIINANNKEILSTDSSGAVHFSKTKNWYQIIHTASIGSGNITSGSAWSTTFNTAFNTTSSVAAGTYDVFVVASISSYSWMPWSALDAFYSLDGGSNYASIRLTSTALNGNHYVSSGSGWANGIVVSSPSTLYTRMAFYGGDYNPPYYGLSAPQFYSEGGSGYFTFRGSRFTAYLIRTA
jgi:hypothetical protein